MIPAAVFLITQEVFWPYCAGISLLLIAAAVMLRDGAGRGKGLERLWALGPTFLAIPMGVFGADHFMSAHSIAKIVPSWIPGHLFIVYFVGVALLAAALSIVTRRHSTLAATLLGTMLFLFVVLMHIPNLAADPHDRFALAVLFRDLSFSAGAFALALQQANGISAGRSRIAAVLLRSAVGVAALVFATKHFLHPEFVPIIPLRQQLPAWMPAHAALAYVTGCVLMAASICMLLDLQASLASTWLGVYVLAIVLLVYVPLMLATPGTVNESGVAQLNYTVDTLAFSGAALLIGRLLALQEASRSAHQVTARSAV